MNKLTSICSNSKCKAEFYKFSRTSGLCSECLQLVKQQRATDYIKQAATMPLPDRVTKLEELIQVLVTGKF